jgi:uroporphyrinogen-III synthase
MLVSMSSAAWRVAVTRDEDALGPWHLALKEAGFEPVSLPIVIEGPPPDPSRFNEAAGNLSKYDWVICASARSVRALTDAHAQWPETLRTAAVGVVTAAAMHAAGAASPVFAETAGARALWDRLRTEDTWQGKRVLIATVPGGRQELIAGLRDAGAIVDAIECYSMQTRPLSEIKREWDAAAPDAVLLASPSTVRQLIDAVGVEALRGVKAIVPIGFTTATALEEAGIVADPPATATFEAVVERLVVLRTAAAGAQAKVEPSQ